MNAQAEQYLTYRVFVSDIRPIVTDNRPSDTSQPTWLIVADPLEGGLIELEGHALPPPYQPRRALVLGPPLKH